MNSLFENVVTEMDFADMDGKRFFFFERFKNLENRKQIFFTVKKDYMIGVCEI
jgi:hypothetical protein